MEFFCGVGVGLDYVEPIIELFSYFDLFYFLKHKKSERMSQMKILEAF